VRRRLKVHAAQRATLVIEGQVALCHRGLNPALAKLFWPPRHREESPVVMDFGKVDNPGAGDA
jgi:hypothetical protein